MEHVTQSAVSQQIRRLERSLGIQLFNRSTHLTTVTDEGVALLPRAQDILKHSAQFEEAARSLSRTLAGQLHIGSPFHGAQCPERQAVLNRLTDAHPKVELAIHNSWTSELIAGLRASSLDMTFVNFSLPESRTPETMEDLADLDFQLVADGPCAFLAPTAVPTRVDGGAADLPLAQATILMYPRDLNPWLHAQRKSAIGSVGAAERELREPSLPGIIEDVTAGRGIFPAIPWELPQPGDAAGVHVLHWDETPFRANLWAVRRRHDSNRITDWLFRDLARQWADTRAKTAGIGSIP